ncbi:MAG: hypothetical protein KAH57_03630 [Thermoplasmata archaeon]|nr:hypothetical protein [Thermoplasmata archaeon]
MKRINPPAVAGVNTINEHARSLNARCVGITNAMPRRIKTAEEMKINLLFFLRNMINSFLDNGIPFHSPLYPYFWGSILFFLRR